MTDNSQWAVLDASRSCCLCDVGGGDHVAATLINSDGTTSLVLAHCGHEPFVRLCMPSCAPPAHEQTGELPLDILRRIVIAQRSNHPPQADE